ncbi:MAG: SLBB domain-containing protein, partial [Actinomycetota bacterium]|nr:SLBB domain-containing protein [Actinomycetota bacterium]
MRRPAVGLIAVAVVIAAVLVVTQRRPPAVDDRLPRAVATSTTAPADATSPPPAAGASSTVAPDARIVVHVAGAVSTPGVVELPASSRVVDAVHAAGGLRADADPDRVNLAAPLADGHRVVIPVVGQP